MTIYAFILSMLVETHFDDTKCTFDLKYFHIENRLHFFVCIMYTNIDKIIAHVHDNYQMVTQMYDSVHVRVTPLLIKTNI